MNVGINVKDIYDLPYPEIQVSEVGPLTVQGQPNGDGVAMLVRDESSVGSRGAQGDAWSDIEVSFHARL